MPATLSRRCGLPEGAGEARQRIKESTGRGARRGAAAAHRGPVAAHARAARGYAARFEPCLLVPAQPCLVPGWRVFSPLGLVAVGAVSRLCAGIAATATLCAAAGDEKRPVFLALGPKAAEMRQSPGDLVLAFVSLLACSFTVLGYALSSFSTPLHHYPRHPVEPHTSCTDKAYAQPVASPTTPQRHQTPWRRNSSYRRRQADRAAAER
jgi:hypothetical protein